MSRFMRFGALLCVLFVGGNAFAAGYTCPSYKKYTSCSPNYYMTSSSTSTACSPSPAAGNACRPCSVMGSNYTCAGGTACPQLSTVNVSYNLNGGSGTTPSATVCTPGTSCTLASGATTSFYRAGYVFKGWSTNSSATSGSTTITTSSATTVYAVWTACAAGTYKPGSGTQASAACSACPSGYPNSEAGATVITACYSNTKSRAWTGSQTACAKPNNCASVTCDSCSKPACDYTAYANSAGTGDGTIKTGCSTNNAACQQTVKSVTANENHYVSGATCPACPTNSISSDGNSSSSCTCKAGYTVGGTPSGATTTNSSACSLIDTTITLNTNSGTGGTGTLYTRYNTGVYTNSARTSTYAMSTSANGITKPTRAYTVSYNANNGSVSTSSNTATYTYKGHYSATSGGTQYIASNGYITANGLTAGKARTTATTWYAQWTSASVTLPTPTRAKYVFNGWYTAASGGTRVGGAGGSYTPTANTTLYAQWTAASCVKGTGVSATSVNSVDSNNRVVCNVTCSSGSYASGTTQIGTAGTASVTTTCSACAAASASNHTASVTTNSSNQCVYTCATGYTGGGTTCTGSGCSCTTGTYTITLNDNGGTGGIGSAKEVYATKWTNSGGTTITTVTVPTRSGYTFRGYYTSDLADATSNTSGGTQRVTKAGALPGNTTFAANATLYAAWCQNCASVSNGTCTLSVSNAGACTYTHTCADGYHISSGSGTRSPVCEKNTYTVAYDANGGTGTTASSSHSYDTAKNLTANGFTNGVKKFLGWSTNKSATSATYSNGQSVKNLTTTNGATVTLYAIWGTCTACSTSHASCTLSAPLGVCTYATSCNTGYHGGTANTYNHACTANTYTVVYDKNATSATGATANSSHTYDTAKNLTANGFTNGTKKFLGWATSSGSTTVAYANGASVKNLTTTNGGTVNLYAVWGADCTCTKGTGVATCTPVAPKGVCGTATATPSNGYQNATCGASNSSGVSACTATGIGYTVTYAAGTGGSGSNQTQNVTFGSSFTTKAANTFSKAHATFAGWSPSSGSYTAASHAYTYSTVGNVTLTATWSCNAGYTLNSTTGACDPCANGTYKESVGNGACSACPTANSTTQRTTFPDEYYPWNSATSAYDKTTAPTVASFNNQTWSSGGASIGNCRVTYRIKNAAATFVVESVGYNSSNGKYDVGGALYYNSVSAGYYLDTKYSETYCNNTNNYMLYKRAIICPAGSYCPGGSVPKCSTGTHDAVWGKNSCPANYANSAAKSTEIGQCYLNTTAGKFVKTGNAAQETCTAGGYCPGGVKVNYGSTGGRTACAAGTANANTGSSAASACATCAAGTYNTTTGNTSCATCPEGKWCTGGTHNAACSSLTGVSVAGGTYTSAAGSKANTACKYTAPTKTITGCKTVTTNQVMYTGSAWPATTYSVSANGGYIISGNGTASATCSQCGAGKYSAGGTATSCGTCANWTYSAAGAASCTDCAAVGDGWTKVSGTGWTSYANCKGTKTGTEINANCSAGVLTRAQTSATAWGNPSITTALQAKAGSYVNGQTCTQCAAGTYTASAGTQTSCTAASKGYYVGSVGSTGQSACAAGKYQDATGQSSCKSCPALTSGYAYTSTTGMDAVTDCTETKSAANISGYCYGGQLTKTAKDTTTWNTATSTLTAKAGSHISGSADSTTCAQCTGATYQTTNGSTATSCTACVAAESGWTAGTGTGWSAATQCFETKNATAISGYCKAGQLKKNATSATAWPAAANISVAFQANAGSIVDGQTCTQCTGATFSAGGTATSCTTCPNGYDDDTSNGKSANTQCKMSVAAGKYVAKANESAASGTCANWTWKAEHLVNYGSTSSCDGACPTPTSGWSKGAGTGWGAVSSCYQTQTPANCASGTIKQNATSTTAWGASTVSAALSANPKYYVNGPACSACPAGKYCTGGTAAATACAVGSYSTGTASACTVCGAGKTTSGTGTAAASACTSCAGITGLATWATPSWSANSVSNLCTVATCTANNYKNGNACPTCASGTNSKYTKSDAGTTSVNSCYLTTDAGKYVATAKAGQVTCPANSYCEGGTTIYYGTGAQTGGSATCASGTSSKYTLSAAGASKVGQCYLTTTAGNYVATAGAGQTTCAANGYCVGGTDVYYNTDGGSTTTGGRALCNALASGFYPNSAAGAKANTDCKTNSISGKYVATENAASATECGTGTYKGAHTVNYGSTSSCSACPDNYKAGAGTTAQNLCKASCAAGTRVATENAACTAITSGNVYILAHTVNYGSTSPLATACPTSYTIAGKTQADHDAKNDCKITCGAGTQVVKADAACTTPAGTNWYSGAHTVSAGSTSGSNVKACLTNYTTPNTTTATDHDAASDCKISCGAGTRIATENATSCTTPSGNWYVGAHSVSQGSTSSVNNCLANYKITGTAATDHDAENDCKITCGGGTYIAAARNTSCSNVGVGYWAASSTVSQGSAGTRNACATGLTTIGYGAGADEAADCGRVLNFNGQKIYLRSEKKTTPALHIGINGTTFYGSMTPGTTKGSLRINKGGTTYSVHDDSM